MGRSTKTSKISLNADGTAWVELTRGYRALIDQEDIPLVAPHKWHVKPSGKTAYAVRNAEVGGTWLGVQMHRDICGLEPRDGSQIDHIDRDGLNNRRCNLRPATYTIQKLNQTRRTDNTSGANGVHLRPWGQWQARVSVKGKRVSLGHFETFGEAKQCRDSVNKIIEDLIADLAPPLDRREVA